MKLRHLLIAAACLIAGIVFYYYSRGSQTPEEYGKGLLEERETREDYMKSNKESPFVTSHETFRGLKYFAPDPAFRVSGRLVSIENKKVVRIPASDNTTGEYLENAYVEFELAGKTNKLLLLEVMEAGSTRGTLFLAFSDETSAKETYGAGRYLDIKKVPGATSILLDFNKAYNPYCAYIDSYSCPFPPPENVLKIAIRAGEKSYH